MFKLLNKLIGKRTYISLAALFIHQLAKEGGIDVPNEDLSKAIDVFLMGCTGVFRYLATNKLDEKPK